MKRIALLARATCGQSTRQAKASAAYNHSCTFSEPCCRRLLSTTTSRSAAQDDDSANTDGEQDPLPNASLSPFDGYHLPKSLPPNWREKMEPYVFGEQEDEAADGSDPPSRPQRRDPRQGAQPLDELTREQIELESHIQAYEESKKARMAADPRFNAHMQKHPDDFAGGTELPYEDNGFWADGAMKGEDPGPDEPFMYDDITSQAHAELEQHRELRELARVTVWDMPLLWDYRREYKPPTASQVLRFRYTTYMGEVHAAARKVVVDFAPAALPDLTQQQTNKLIKLLGIRYNPSTARAKMSCERFPTPAQNKRYLGDLIDKLVAEARDPTDTFEDVPFDFRHHKPKTKLAFPAEWKITPERRRILDQVREAQEKAELDAEQQGRLVQGGELVRKRMLELEPGKAGLVDAPEEQRVPVMVPATPAGARPRMPRV